MAASPRNLRDLFDLNWQPPEPPRWDGHVSRVLRAHPRVIDLTHTAFAMTAKLRLECGLFWYGATRESESVVLGVVVPTQINTWGHYELPELAIDQLSDATRPRGWFNLAQVHTHPSTWVGHSPYDDHYANSRNALSLVFPSYGCLLPRWPGAIGVHEFLDGQWRRLADARVIERVAFDPSLPVPELLDLRPRHAS